MSNLFEAQKRLHNSAVELLKKDKLTDEEKEFVFLHWNNGEKRTNGRVKDLFTPFSVAYKLANAALAMKRDEDFSVVDLCAGIGILSYVLAKRYPGIKLTCVEINPEYVEIGKKLVPEADWYCLDLCDLEQIKKLGMFDFAVSHPPFGKVATLESVPNLQYTGAESELKVMEIAAMLAKNSIFIVPQHSAANFNWFGVDSTHDDLMSKELLCFLEQQTGLMMKLVGDFSSCPGLRDTPTLMGMVCIDNSEYREAFFGIPTDITENPRFYNLFS